MASGTDSPFGRTQVISNSARRNGRSWLAKNVVTSPDGSGGSNRLNGWPTTLLAGKPKMRSALTFQLVIRSSREKPKMASREEFTIAASRACSTFRCWLSVMSTKVSTTPSTILSTVR